MSSEKEKLLILQQNLSDAIIKTRDMELFKLWYEYQNALIEQYTEINKKLDILANKQGPKSNFNKNLFS